MADLEQRLFGAASVGDLEWLQACLAAGADLDSRDDHLWMPLPAAAFNKHAACVSALLAAGADPDARTIVDSTPLHFPVGGCPDSVAALLAAGASPSAANKYRGTPAHLAALHNHAPVLRQLLAADPAATLLRDSDGRTPLQVALRYANADAAACWQRRPRSRRASCSQQSKRPGIQR
jgi:ankyrin repeat protein